MVVGLRIDIDRLGVFRINLALGRRTVDRRRGFLGRALDAFSPEECRDYFRHCGYPIPDAARKPKRLQDRRKNRPC
jgi:hypothetical protein